MQTKLNRRLMLKTAGVAAGVAASQLVVPGEAQAASRSGYLRYNSDAYGFDWVYPWTKSRYHLFKFTNTKVRIRSRFIWQGNGYDQGHAEAGYVQLGANSGDNSNNSILNSPWQSPRYSLWNFGVTCLVAPRGLVMEFFEKPFGRVFSWSQQHRHGNWVIGSGPLPSLPLVSLSTAIHNPPPNGYISSFPSQYHLKRGQIYRVRTEIENIGGGWGRLTGELRIGSKLKQKGSINFQLSRFFPNNENLRGAVGRTPNGNGSNVFIHYYARDY